MSALIDLSSQSADLVAATATRVLALRGPASRPQSAILWSPGLIVTAQDTLEDRTDFEALLPDGKLVSATLVGRDATTDIALLKAETGEGEAWRSAETPRPGALAFLVGRGDHSPLPAMALVSEVGPAWRSMRGGDIDARVALALRHSRRLEGGAVVAADGGLIGMAVTGPRGRTLVIPAATIARVVAVLSDKGYIPHGYLGVSLHPTGRGNGAVIVGVEPEGPAEAAGFLIGDIVTTWNGEPIASVRDVSTRLAQTAIGSTAKIGIQRGGNALHIDARIGERPRR